MIMLEFSIIFNVLSKKTFLLPAQIRQKKSSIKTSIPEYFFLQGEVFLLRFILLTAIKTFANIKDVT